MTSEFDIYNKIQRYLDKNNEVSYGNFEVGGFVAQQSKKGIILDVRKIKNTIKIKVWFTGSEKPEKMQAVVKKQKSNKNFIKLDDTYEVVYEKNGNDFFQIKQKQSISSDDEDFEEEEEEVPVAAPAIVPAPASPISESQRQKELRARENAQADETKIQQADETKIQQAETNSLLNLFEPVVDREENKFIERVYSIKNKDDPFHNEIAMIKNYFLAQPAPVVDEKEEDVSESARIAVPPAPVAAPVVIDLVSEDKEKEKTKRDGPPQLSNPQDMAAFMNKKVETCGYLRSTNDGYYTAVVDGKNITGQGDRAACAWNEPYKKLLWHTHPKGVIAYPSAEDILKVVKPRRDISMIEKSFIYTMWGVWELYATRKAEMSLKDIEKLIRKLDNKYSKKMYNKTEKGRARTLTADMEKYVDAYIQRVETNKKLSKRGFTIILHKNSRDYLLQ